MYYVYILKSTETGDLYKGFTKDLGQRFKEHNSGKSIYTKDRGPWDLIYYEAFVSKVDARREELFLKSGRGKERIKYLLRGEREDWPNGKAIVSKTIRGNP